ncbi:MAG: exo-alpha-sialidase [Proteobacteria bacterium]|nr:exo-alpha-sialidase [Pseudomonadota bacterium]
MNRQADWLTISLLCLASLAVGCAKEPAPGIDTVETRVLQTPSGQGSMAPNLATGPDGTVVLSWIEAEGDGDALRFSVFEDGEWRNIRTVVSGDNLFVNWADFPSVVPIADSWWAAHWLVRREAGGYAYDIHAAFSSDAGNSWSESFLPHSDDTDTEHGFVTLFPDHDGVGMIWLDGRNMLNEYDENDVGASGMTLRSAVFGTDRTASRKMRIDDLICDCCRTDVALTSHGPVAVYRDRTIDETRDIYLTRFVDGKWQSGTPLGDDNWKIPGCPVNGPVIQANGSQLAVAWFSAGNQQPRVQVAWSDDAGETLSDPVPVADGRLLGQVGAALLPSGDMAVTWLGNVGGGSAELHLRRVSSSGEAGPDQVIAEAAGVAPFSVPQVVLVGESLLLAWTDTSGEDSLVKTALIPLQFLE